MPALANETPRRPIGPPHSEQLLALGAIHAVDERPHVRRVAPLHLASIHDPLQGAHGALGTALGSEARRAGQEVLLVQRLPHLAHGVREQLVLARHPPNRPGFPLRFWEGHTAERLMTIRLRLQAPMEVLQIPLQMLSIRFLRDAIHAHRCV